MRSKRSMAAQFTEITLDEMDKFLKRGWRVLRPKMGDEKGEVYYNLFLSPHVMIRVWTSIPFGRATGADVGADAIRIQLMSVKAKRPLTRGKAPIVKRTQGWKSNLQDRIEDAIETYEAQEGYFEERSGGEPPEQERIPVREVAPAPREEEQTVREEPPVPPVPPVRPRSPSEAKATFTKLRTGDWGLRIEGEASPGDKIRTERKDGSVQWVTVGEVVWRGVDRGTNITVTTIARGQRTASEDDWDAEDYENPYSKPR